MSTLNPSEIKNESRLTGAKLIFELFSLRFLKRGEGREALVKKVEKYDHELQKKTPGRSMDCPRWVVPAPPPDLELYLEMCSFMISLPVNTHKGPAHL